MADNSSVIGLQFATRNELYIRKQKTDHKPILLFLSIRETKPKKTSKTLPHRSLLKADLEKRHSYLKKMKILLQRKNNKNPIHPHAFNTLLENTPRTIDTHISIDLWRRQEKEGERGKEGREKGVVTPSPPPNSAILSLHCSLSMVLKPAILDRD